MPDHVYIVDSLVVPHAPDDAIEYRVLGGCAALELLRIEHEDQFLPYADRATAIILWHHITFSRAIVEKLANARIIVRNGVGFDNVDVDAAARMGIAVSNVPDYGTEEVADHAIALCLALTRQLRPLVEDVAQGHWRFEKGISTRRIRGSVFGVVGCGRIGTAAALRAKALGYDVVFYDPYLPPGYEKAIGVRRAWSLDDLLAASDVVSLHAPLTAETHYMIDAPQLRLMKPTAYLVNTARGGIVRHEALEEALAGGWIAGAALDVLEVEPHGLELAARFQNCLITPHSAFYSQESIIEMRTSSAGIVRDALLHGRYRNVVNGVNPSQRRS